MGRANNTSRSLQILSKLQGWDPSKIDGVDYPNGSYTEDRVTKGEQLGAPLPRDPQEPCPDPKPAGPDTRGPGPGGQSHGRGNPMAGKG